MLFGKWIPLSALCAALALCGCGCATIRDLREINTQQQQDIRVLRAELTEYKDGYTQLKVDYEKAQAKQLEDLSRERREKDDLKAEHERQTAEWQRAKAELIAAYEAQLKARADNEAALGRRIAELESDNKNALARLQEAEANRASLADQLKATQQTLAQRDTSLEKARADADTAQKRIETLAAELATVSAERDTLKQTMERLERDSAKALSAEKAAKAGEAQLKETAKTLSQAERTVAEFKTLLEEKDAQLEKCQSRADELESDKDRLSKSLSTTERALEQKSNSESIVLYRLKSLTEALSSEEPASAKIVKVGDQVKSLYDLVENARRDIAPPEPKLKAFYTKAIESLQELIDQGMVTVQTDRRGVVISIPSDNIFESREPRVRSAGPVIDMLSRIANLASEPPQYDVMVEGHTDNDPVKNLIFMDNLHLSMLRAVNVTRKLTSEIEPHIPPDRVRAVACGEHYSVSPTDKARNRRIEIVFTPCY